MDYVSASPFRVPIARLAAAQAVIEEKKSGKKIRAPKSSRITFTLRRQTAIRPLDSRPLTIGICGGTGSGKTTITRIIVTLSEENVLVLQQDNYYKDYPHAARRARQTKLRSSRFGGYAAAGQHVRALREGQTIERPVYDFAQHRRAVPRCALNRALR